LFKALAMNPDDKSEQARKTDSTRLVKVANLERQYEEVCRLRKEIEDLKRPKTALATASTAIDRASCSNDAAELANGPNLQ
jgi:hypothetical protein